MRNQKVQNRRFMLRTIAGDRTRRDEFNNWGNLSGREVWQKYLRAVILRSPEKLTQEPILAEEKLSKVQAENSAVLSHLWQLDVMLE